MPNRASFAERPEGGGGARRNEKKKSAGCAAEKSSPASRTLCSRLSCSLPSSPLLRLYSGRPIAMIQSLRPPAGKENKKNVVFLGLVLVWLSLSPRPCSYLSSLFLPLSPAFPRTPDAFPCTPSSLRKRGCGGNKGVVVAWNMWCVRKGEEKSWMSGVGFGEQTDRRTSPG